MLLIPTIKNRKNIINCPLPKSLKINEKAYVNDTMAVPYNKNIALKIFYF